MAFVSKRADNRRGSRADAAHGHLVWAGQGHCEIPTRSQTAHLQRYTRCREVLTGMQLRVSLCSYTYFQFDCKSSNLYVLESI